FRLALPARRPLGFELLENVLAKGGSFRRCFRALADVVAGVFGEVSRYPLGQGSERLVAQVAFNGNPRLHCRSLCGLNQQQESGPALETIGLGGDAAGGVDGVL
ncbi:unnamed protein product, partial [Pylaiella littoralis]